MRIKKEPCIVCEGKGYIEEFWSFYVPCRVCHGSGVLKIKDEA